MGNPGSPVETPRWDVSHRDTPAKASAGAPIPGYRRLDGPVPVFHPPRLTGEAKAVRDHLARGTDALAEIIDGVPPGGAETPHRQTPRRQTPRRGVSTGVALLVADGDWGRAPREGRRPYPPGLPYFTRSVVPPVLVLPEALSPVFRPRTGATFPLAVWHELAHAFLLRGEVVKTPAWLGEFAPQAASAAVARGVGLPLGGHLGLIDREPGFTVRGFGGRSSAGDQMKFQNLLLVLGVAALEELGEDFLGRLFRALWEEEDVVDEERAEVLLAGALGPGGEAWLSSRPEF